MKFRMKKTQGFTIIETLIAITILLLALMAPLTLARQSLASAESARLELVAVYLAQEGMEYVRNLRDANFLASNNKGGKDWLDSMDDCMTDEGCGVEPVSDKDSVVECSVLNEDCRLKIYKNKDDENDPLNGFYAHRQTGGKWWDTDIYRKVCITSVASAKDCDESNNLQTDDDVRVNVIVKWQAGSLGERTLVVRGNLANWYEQ